MATTLQLRKLSLHGLRERDAVLHQLREILASEYFCSSKRYPALLQYIVEKTLAGQTDCLKERTIGIEVFHRPPTYDTNADTVVRFTAGEVRKRLAAYYHENGHSADVRITLPAGSYIPEFLYELEEESKTKDASPTLVPEGPSESGIGASVGLPSPTDQTPPGQRTPFRSGPMPTMVLGFITETNQRLLKPGQLKGLLLLVMLVLTSGVAAKFWLNHQDSAMDTFWRPVVHDRGTVLLCAGGNVFAQSPVPGFFTAGKETEYPYFSLQTTTSVTLLSSLIERSGATPQFDFAASTPLPELHSHPIILLNAYNNQWTIRLVAPLRFHFSSEAESGQAIVDQTRPQIRWARDLTIPYSNADDYGLVARFWDTTTDNWVVVLAGLGRNGTEAASQFVTSPHYMQVLREQVQGDFSSRNIEAVLKTKVIDGKTGPPSIVAVHVW